MLAQSNHAVLPAAAHDPGGSSPASSLLGSAVGKKGRGIAGLFADILSQAQKSAGLKAGAAEGALAKPSDGETHKSQRKKDTQVSSQSSTHSRVPAGGEPAAPKEGLESARRLRAGIEAVAHSAEARAAGSAASRERRLGERPGDGADPDALLPRAADDRRRLRDKKDSAADEALAAATLSFKPPPANASKARASAPGDDANPSIDKKAERASSEPKLTVLDLRRSGEARREAAKAEPKTEDPGKDSIREAKAPGSESGREVYRELSLDARAAGEAGAGSASGKADASPPRGQDFQSIMAERMRDAWNGEIVQSAHIVLKDGDAGIIRLRLRPESLGNVKIELNLSENNISGRIIVESDEAKNAFERNMNQLADAFKQGGFESASLQVSVGGGSGGGANPGASREGVPGGPFFSERLRSAVGSLADPATAASAYARRGGSVDILA